MLEVSNASLPRRAHVLRRGQEGSVRPRCIYYDGLLLRTVRGLRNNRLNRLCIIRRTFTHLGAGQVTLTLGFDGSNLVASRRIRRSIGIFLCFCLLQLLQPLLSLSNLFLLTWADGSLLGCLLLDREGRSDRILSFLL